MTVDLGDFLCQPLEAVICTDTAPGDPYTLMTALGLLGGRGTLLDLLRDVPTSYDAWRPETDLRPAQAAARRSQAIGAGAARLGIDLESTAFFEVDRVASFVLVEGSYLRLSRDEGLLEFGELATHDGRVLLLDVPRRYSGIYLWTLAHMAWDAEDAKPGFHNKFAFSEPLSEVIPRWHGMTISLSVARVLATAFALDALWTLIPVEDQRFVQTLSLVHTPLTRDAATAVTNEELYATLQWLEEAVASAGEGRVGEVQASLAPKLPAPRMLKGHEAAEAYAAEVLAAVGFRGVVRTPKGADGGVDVVGEGVVAQVKMEALPTGRDRLQALFGVASVEQCQATFFSLAGYTSQALVWAERADIALFEFGYDGGLTATNASAQRLIEDGAPQ